MEPYATGKEDCKLEVLKTCSITSMVHLLHMAW